jgi:hypothetical protein
MRLSLSKFHGRRVRHANHQNRAVSEILANIILVLGSVGFGVVIFFWGLGFTAQSQGQFGQGSQLSNQRIQEQFGIEQVKFNTTGSNSRITIYVRNFGDLPLTVDQVFLNGVSYVPSSPVLVRAREAQPLTISTSSPPLWTSARTYTIRLASQRGNTYESNFQAP